MQRFISIISTLFLLILYSSASMIGSNKNMLKSDDNCETGATYIITERNDHTCNTDCDCTGTRRCSVVGGGWCNECEDVIASFFGYKTLGPKICEGCTKNCLKCTGPGTNQCIKCNKNSFVLNGQCIPLTCKDSENYVVKERVGYPPNLYQGYAPCDNDCECSGSKRCFSNNLFNVCFDCVSAFSKGNTIGHKKCNSS